jgi:hypothetical protein
MLALVNLSARLGETTRLFPDVARNADLRRLLLAWAASNLASRASAIAVAVYAYDAVERAPSTSSPSSGLPRERSSLRG